MADLLPSERAAYQTALEQAERELCLCVANIVRLTGLLDDDGPVPVPNDNHAEQISQTLRTLAWRSRHPERLFAHEAEALLQSGLSALNALTEEHREIQHEIYALSALVWHGGTVP